MAFHARLNLTDGRWERGNPYACPDCRSEGTQRVPVAHQLGVSHGRGVALGVAGGGDDRLHAGLAGMSATSSTPFAAGLAPPVAPRPVGVVGMLAIFVYGGAAISVGLILGFGGDHGEAFRAGFAISALAMVFARMSSTPTKSDREAYARQLDRWRRSFVCLRCGQIFVASTDDWSSRAADLRGARG